MADQELSELTSATELQTTDILYLVRDPGGAGEGDYKVAGSVFDTRYTPAATTQAAILSSTPAASTAFAFATDTAELYFYYGGWYLVGALTLSYLGQFSFDDDNNSNYIALL